MKVKELIKKFNEFLEIPELDAIVSASSLDAVELTDELLNEFEKKTKSLLSLESAKNNPEIKEYFRKELTHNIFGMVDKDLNEFADEILDKEKALIIKNTTSTPRKVAAFNNYVREQLSLKSGGKEKEEVGKLLGQINELNNKHAQELKEKEDQINNKENEFKNTLIRGKFKNLAASYNLQPAYEVAGIKDVLFNNFFEKISAKATLKLAPTGEIEIYQKDQPELKMFDGAKQIGIKDLIEPEIQPYITKAPQKGEKRIEKTSHPIVSDTPRGKRSPLAERIESARSEYQTH